MCLVWCLSLDKSPELTEGICAVMLRGSIKYLKLRRAGLIESALRQYGAA